MMKRTTTEELIYQAQVRLLQTLYAHANQNRVGKFPDAEQSTIYNDYIKTLDEVTDEQCHCDIHTNN